MAPPLDTERLQSQNPFATMPSRRARSGDQDGGPIGADHRGARCKVRCFGQQDEPGLESGGMGPDGGTARKEGSIVLAHTAGENEKRVTDVFEAKFPGIKVERL